MDKDALVRPENRDSQLKGSNTYYLASCSDGYEPAVDYLFGIPRAIEPGGVVMNVRLGNYVTTHDNDREARVRFNQQVGMLSSALEHAIPEQMFVTPDNPGEAISAVKALAKATQAGQRIYHITPANQASSLPNIHHDPLVMDEIRAALAVGKEVTTHTDAVSVPGWSGAGYIIVDPETGVGAYKIGGGENGGWMIIGLAAITIMFLASFAFGPIAVIVGAIAALSALFNFADFVRDLAFLPPDEQVPAIRDQVFLLVISAVTSFFFVHQINVAATVIQSFAVKAWRLIFNAYMLVFSLSIGLGSRS